LVCACYGKKLRAHSSCRATGGESFVDDAEEQGVSNERPTPKATDGCRKTFGANSMLNAIRLVALTISTLRKPAAKECRPTIAMPCHS
jgi:hypothetical protein